jgi:ribonuclease PH
MTTDPEVQKCLDSLAEAIAKVQEDGRPIMAVFFGVLYDEGETEAIAIEGAGEVLSLLDSAIEVLEETPIDELEAAP